MDKNDYEKIKNTVLGGFFYYDELDSTNTEALKCGDASPKSLFLTKNQTNGRGRKGRTWEASKGGIYMTVLLKPKEITEDVSAMTLAVGLAVSRVIPKSLIKWPNDIILGSKKVAGILIETKITGKTGVIAIGVGINANNTEFPEELSEKATSIRLFSGMEQNETELIIKVYNEIISVLDEFSQGFCKIRDEYSEKCVTINREITVIKNGKNKKMYAVGIGDKGELLAEADGKIEVINFGEVSVRGLLGYCL